MKQMRKLIPTFKGIYMLLQRISILFAVGLMYAQERFLAIVVTALAAVILPLVMLLLADKWNIDGAKLGRLWLNFSKRFLIWLAVIFILFVAVSISTVLVPYEGAHAAFRLAELSFLIVLCSHVATRVLVWDYTRPERVAAKAAAANEVAESA